MAERRNGQPQTHPNPDAVERAEQAYRVVTLKGEGKTFPQIAETMKCGVATAHKLFKLGIQQMAPLAAREEISVARVQLEQQYHQICLDIESTNDPAIKAPLYSAALRNIQARIKLAGGADLTIKHTVQDQFTAELEALHAAFDADQDIRNATRANARMNGR